MPDTHHTDDTVRGLLQFTIPTDEIPVTQVNPTGGGRDDPKTGNYEMREVTVQNGRPISDELNLKFFEFWIINVFYLFIIREISDDGLVLMKFETVNLQI